MRRISPVACLAVAAGACAAPTAQAQGPPPPVAANGARVITLGSGIPTPTSFAFGTKKTVFVGANGPESMGRLVASAAAAKGGVWVVKGGQASRVPATPSSVFGLAWRKGVLYATSGRIIYALRGWDGSRFASKDVVYKGPKGFPGLNGIAFGPDGRLYTGVSLAGEAFDAKLSPAPLANSVLSMKSDGTDVKVFATRLRQPWQLTFVKGIAEPFGTDLGQDNLGNTKPPDYILRYREGDNYGFAKCNWVKPSRCTTFAKPLQLLPAHSSPMGIGSLGNTLYVALFGGRTGSPEVVSLPASGGTVSSVLSGFVAPVVALAARKGHVYTGDLTGTIYRVKV